MSAIPKRKLTEEEYLAIERAAEFKSEYYDGEMYAMAGATFPHNRIKDNLARHLGNALDGGPYAVLTSDMRVKPADPVPTVIRTSLWSAANRNSPTPSRTHC